MPGAEYFFKKWGVEETGFAPLHPHVGHDQKTFREALDIGVACEDLARERLQQQRLFRAVDSYCDRMTTDIYGKRRDEGKRILIDGQTYIAPDFKVSNSPRETYLVDVKGKQYHSYYHKQRRIQQVVDTHVIHDYLAIGRFYDMPILILIHLIPASSMGIYGNGETARIHTGLKWQPLTEAQLGMLVRQYPVNDWYYLINAYTIQYKGRQGIFHDIDGREKQGYYFNLAEAVAGPAQGILPPMEAWRTVAQNREEER